MLVCPHDFTRVHILDARENATYAGADVLYQTVLKLDENGL